MSSTETETTSAMNMSCVPPVSIICFTLHSILTGLSAIDGALTSLLFAAVSLVSLNLSISLPLFTPQKSVDVYKRQVQIFFKIGLLQE